MATFLDISLLPYFSDIFTFLLVFVVLYAILQLTKVLGDNKGIQAIVAFSISMLMLMSRQVLDVVKFITPWFVLLFIFGLFLIIGFRWMGNSEVETNALMSKWGLSNYWLLAIAIIILIAALGSVYGSSLLPVTGGEGGNQSNQFSSNVAATLFNVRIIGMVFLFLMATFTIVIFTSGGPIGKK